MTASATDKAAPIPANEVERYIARCREMSEDGRYSWWSRLAEILADLQAALPITNLADWSIDTSTGTDILVYKQCSVIEDDQAHLVMRLLRDRLGGVTESGR